MSRDIPCTIRGTYCDYSFRASADIRIESKNLVVRDVESIELDLISKSGKCTVFEISPDNGTPRDVAYWLAVVQGILNGDRVQQEQLTEEIRQARKENAVLENAGV